MLPRYGDNLDYVVLDCAVLKLYLVLIVPDFELV